MEFAKKIRQINPIIKIQELFTAYGELPVIAFHAWACGGVVRGAYESSASGGHHSPEKILFVVTSHSTLGNTGKPTGFYLSEASHPYKVIVDAGYEVDFVSPEGGKAPVEGVDLDDIVNQWFQDDAKAQHKVENTLKPEEVNPDKYEAIYYVGGHGTVWDFKDNSGLQEITRTIWENGGVVASVCHGPIGLINVTLSDGSYLVDGKKMAAFSNAEEDSNGTTSVVPFLVADELEKHGAKLEHAGLWEAKVITDGRLVSGQNPASAMGVGKAIVKKLKKI